MDLKEQILAAIEQIEFRKEKSLDDEDLYYQFAPIVSYDRLACHNTQIIFGRNGTGKTHLLKSFNYYCKFKFEDERVLSYYLDAQTLDIGSSTKIDAQDLIIIFYKKIINKLIKNLQSHFEDENTITLLQKIFKNETQKRLNIINNSILKINQILNFQLIEEKFKNYSREEKTDKTTKKKMSAGISTSAKVGISSQTATGEAKLDASGSTENSNNKIINQVFEGLSVIDYDEIRINLEYIIENCGANSIFLLIDEWSSINLSLQPIIAEMLRKTLSISPKISLKIVALSYFTELSTIIESPQRIGLQTGIDINKLADLDELLNFDINQQNVKDFLTLVLYNHISPTFDKHYTIVEVEKILIEEIFDSDETYLELVRASEGNPRDFLSLLVQTTNINNFDENNRIPKKNVIKSAARYFTDSKEPAISSYTPATDLFKKIFDHTVTNNQKVFFITKPNIDRRIKELWHYRFIHLLNPSVSLITKDKSICDFAVYSIDYGKLLSLRVHATGEIYFKKITDVRNYLETCGIDFTIPRALYKVLVGAKLIDENKIRKLIGTSFFDVEDYEKVKKISIDELINKCLIDDIVV